MGENDKWEKITQRNGRKYKKWWGNYRNMQKIPNDRQICKEWFGGIFELSENSPILETVKILWQDKAVNKKEFPEECARER